MKNIRVNFAHVCDMAFLSQGGKVNIIGIFKRIFGKNFPANHPRFSIIVSLTAEDAIGSHTENIKIIREDDKKEIIPELNVNFKVNEKIQDLNFIGDIINAKFEKPGKYLIKIIFDNEEIHSIPLDLVKS